MHPRNFNILTMTSKQQYHCDECGATFSVQQRYANHASTTGHTVNADGPADTVTPSLLKRAFAKLRFGRDRDGDGTLDISRTQLYQQLAVLAVGTIVGHTLAHDPTAAYKVITAATALTMGGRGIASISWLPIQPEWFDSKSFTQLGIGMIFGAALVILPWGTVLDTVSHVMGEGHAPGAH